MVLLLIMLFQLYRREYKNWLYCLLQSQNNFMTSRTCRKSCKSHIGPAERCETQLGLLNVLCQLSLYPPHFDLSDLQRELYILSAEEQFLSTQCCCHSVLWHTVLHRSIIFIISNSISLLHFSRRKSKFDPFLGSHNVSFWLGILAFYSCFPTLP